MNSHVSNVRHQRVAVHNMVKFSPNNMVFLLISLGNSVIQYIEDINIILPPSHDKKWHPGGSSFFFQFYITTFKSRIAPAKLKKKTI